MNIKPKDLQPLPDRSEAEHALAVLKSWAAQSSPAEIATLNPMISRLLPGQELQNYPALARAYPEEFEADDAYRASLPDLQNGPESLIKGARRHIEQPGRGAAHDPVWFGHRIAAVACGGT